METLNILDGFSGSGSWVKKWRDSSYNVCIDSVDIVKRPHINYVMDMENFVLDKEYHIMYFSPPCNNFTKLMNINKKGCTKEEFDKSVRLAKLSFELGKKAKWCYIIENPYTGKMKDLRDENNNLLFPNPQIVDYSEYGFSSRKRTAIWSNIDLKLKTKSEISYNNKPLYSMSKLDAAKIPDKLAIYVKWIIIKKFLKELQPYKKNLV